MKLKKTPEFENWFLDLDEPFKKIVDARLLRIEKADHFGNVRYLGDYLAELKWKNGLRIYFMKYDLKTVLLLLGGIKNGQKKDIKKARLLLRRYAGSKNK